MTSFANNALQDFLGVSRSIYEGALTQFFKGASVISRLVIGEAEKKAAEAKRKAIEDNRDSELKKKRLEKKRKK
ncbi:hypothetical protein F511_41031 [Dorcoceras hygrometricum]|uniref:Uncharacterized protein n=1 Tax=Dorcoceras hygrometricum TaxID=472368 RepID=A0A2Z7BQA0_9LAMI|nr:hypothetical protein F511_41031 [Dorcoceras hygrometricum]